MKKKFRRMTAVLLAVVMTTMMIPIATVTVSAGQRDDIVNIAINEANTNGGYLGSSNKYNNWNGLSWCAYFVVWCARQAGIDSDIIPDNYSCSSIKRWYEDRGMWHYSAYYDGNYTPRAGDLVIYDWNYNPDDGDHIGIVTGISGGCINTVEGNTSGNGYSSGNLRYRESYLSLNNGQIIGYCSPNYNEPVVLDYESPTYDKVYFSNISDTSFRVCAVPKDNIGIRNVSIVVWTSANGQDDMILYNAVNDGNGTYYIDVNRSDHSQIENPLYIIHVHAYDFAGNDALYPTSIDYGDKESPTYDKVYFTNVTDTSFRVCAIPKDKSGIRNVSIVVWTSANGQDDMIEYNAENDGNGTYYIDVNKSNHSQIENPLYIIHIHAYDYLGNDACYPISMDYGDKELPTYDKVGFSNVTNDSFRVYATPKDNSGIRNVSMVVWTSGNGQSDMILHNATDDGNGTYFIDVNRSDYAQTNNSTYIIHIHAYDYMGNDACYPISMDYGDKELPTYDKVGFSNVTNDSFRVYATPKDNMGIRNVSIVVWTEADGQNDMILHNATDDGNGTYYVDVNRSDYSPIKNSKYIIHIHAYDYAGNDACYPTSMDYSIKSDTGKNVSEGEYRIVTAVNENKALDVCDASKEDGANIQIYSNLSDSKQTFRIKYLDNGFYNIVNTNSGFGLDVWGGTYLNNTNVAQCPLNGGNNQEWMLKESGDGYYYIVSRSNGLALDLTNALDEDGANVAVHTQNQSTAQKWKLRRVLNQYMINVKSWKYVSGIMKPTVKVTVDDNTLIEDTDYTISSYIENNKLYAKITGIGNYCDSVSIEYQEPQYEIGDTNLDGNIDVRDVTAIQRQLAETEMLNGDQLLTADVDGDGVVTVADATLLQMYLAEFDVSFG